MNQGDILFLVDDKGNPLCPGSQEICYSTREDFRITSIGVDGSAQGERWDERQQRYRPMKPIPLHNGLQKITVEYAEDEL